MERKDGTGQIIFTDHAIYRMYTRRVHVAKVLMTIDNPDREMDSDKGERYRRLIKGIGKRTVYVSIVREMGPDGKRKIVVISVAWRVRYPKPKKKK